MVYKYIYVGAHFAHTWLENWHISTKPCLLTLPLLCTNTNWSSGPNYGGLWL